MATRCKNKKSCRENDMQKARMQLAANALYVLALAMKLWIANGGSIPWM